MAKLSVMLEMDFQTSIARNASIDKIRQLLMTIDDLEGILSSSMIRASKGILALSVKSGSSS